MEKVQASIQEDSGGLVSVKKNLPKFRLFFVPAQNPEGTFGKKQSYIPALRVKKWNGIGAYRNSIFALLFQISSSKFEIWNRFRPDFFNRLP